MTLRAKFPLLWAIYSLIREGSPTFSGWGMTTTSTYPPWSYKKSGLGSKTANGFQSAQEEITKKIKNQSFVLSQFTQNIDNQIQMLESLRWRHYIVYWSARLASQRCPSPRTPLVECGVCDGLTLFFAAKAAIMGTRKKAQVFAYDSWAPIKESGLMHTEKKLAGAYSHLSLDNTKRNLKRFSESMVWNCGFIPNSFRFSKNPNSIDWLHLDLNSALATQKSLEFFFPQFSRGTVVLFDDYGWKGHEETKKQIDRFVARVGMNLFHLPTGQAFAFFVL